MDKQSDAQGDGTTPVADTSIIQFGIVCCAVTMVIVLAVALAAS